MNILQQAFQNIQRNAGGVARGIASNVVPGVAPLQRTIQQVQRVPQVQQIQNKVMNTKFLPGQVNTIGQVAQNVRQDPAKYILSSSLAQGRLNTGNQTFDTNIARPTGHALNSLIQNSTAGLLRAPSAPTQTWQDKVGAGVGLAGAFANPYNPANMVLGKVGGIGERTAMKAVGSKALPQFLKIAAKNVAGEAAQTAVLGGAQAALGQKTDLPSQLVQGLGLRGLTGVGKGLSIAKHRTSMAEGDVQSIKDTISRMIDRKPDINYALNSKKNDEIFLRQMAGDYLDKTFAQKAKLDDIAQELMNRIRVDQNAREITLPSMGITNNRTDKNILPLKSSSKLSIGSQQIPETVPGAPKMPSVETSSSRSIAQVPNSENPYFNTNKLNVKSGAKAQVNKTIQEVRPQIEQIVGKKLSNKEVIETANSSAKVLNRVVDRAQTQDFTARLLKTREQLAASAESGVVDKAYIDNLLTIKSHATDIARKLQSFNIGADPKLITSKGAILDAVLKVEQDTAKVTEAAKGVDFNDLKQATDFYRKFIKPTTSEWIDLVRYNSMLSSPNTHINNAASNLVNTTIVAPIEKTITGTLDFLASKATGKQQTQFASEGAAYAKGYASSFHDAAHAFADAMKGKTITGNLDVRQIPLSTKSSITRLSIPTRLLEASDQFFTKLVKGGEEGALSYRKSKGVNVGNIETQAAENAAYRLFRSELHDKRQGTVLNAIDDFTGLVQKARNSSNPITSTIAKFTLPFVQTPMNIVKQGIEYSPAGIITLPGAANKTEQLSKVILGSSAAAATAMLVSSGRTTWSEPTDPTKRAAFRAAGLQPYAIKVGDKWVSYAKLPPALGFPIAFISALHDAEQNQTIDQNQLDVILNASAKFGNFFADQSYVKNIGDLVSAAKGSPEAMTRFVSNYPQQLVPYRALMGWMARLIDPYQRQVNTDAGVLEKQVQQLFTQIPGLSMSVPARLDGSGEPIPNQNKEINAFSPLRVTNENPEKKAMFDFLQQKTLLNKNQNIIKEQIKSGKEVTLGQADASGEAPTSQIELLKAKYKDDVLKAQVEQSGTSQFDSKGNIIYKNENGNASTIDLSPPTKGEGIDAFTNQDWQYSKARTVYSSPITPEQKQQAYTQLGVTEQQVAYDYKATKSNDIKTQYVLSKSQNVPHDQVIQGLELGRQPSASGAVFATDGVLTSLADAGLISEAEAKRLKNMDYNKLGKLKVAPAKKGKKGRKLKVRKVSLKTPKPLKFKVPKLPKLSSFKVPKEKKVKKLKTSKLPMLKLKKKGGI